MRYLKPVFVQTQSLIDEVRKVPLGASSFPVSVGGVPIEASGFQAEVVGPQMILLLPI